MDTDPENKQPHLHNMKHVNHQFLPGLHIAIIANFSGGCGGSLLALELYAALRSYKLNAILATNDHTHVYQNMGSDLRLLPVISGQKDQDEIHNLHDIKQLVTEARTKKTFLIIDIKAGYASAHQMLNALRDSGAFESSSVTALLPLISGDHGVRGAEIALKTMANMGIKVKRGLIRMWTLPRNPGRPDISALPQFPMWTVAHLPQHALVMINRGYWNVREAKVYLKFQCPALDRGTLPKVIAHFEAAKEAMYDAIIRPITRHIPVPMQALVRDYSAFNFYVLTKIVFQSANQVDKSDQIPSSEITITMIAGKLHRWRYWPGRWEAYSPTPGDLLRVWTPPD